MIELWRYNVELWMLTWKLTCEQLIVNWNVSVNLLETLMKKELLIKLLSKNWLIFLHRHAEPMESGVWSHVLKVWTLDSCTQDVWSLGPSALALWTPRLWTLESARLVAWTHDAWNLDAWARDPLTLGLCTSGLWVLRL